MRGRLALIVLAAVLAGGGWFFHRRFEVGKTDNGWIIVPRQPATATSFVPAAPSVRTGPTIRIASFNIQVFGRGKLEKPHVMDILAEIVRQFDIVAVQEVRSQDQDVVPRFVELINAAGRHYDYVIGPRLGRTSSQEQYAFLFDRQTVEVDRNQLYTIDDPDDLLHRPPLVGWFRARGPPAEQAFTCTLVNVHVDPDEVDQELSVLDSVFRVVREDGRQEDDVIVLGDFNADYHKLGQMLRTAGITCAIKGAATNVRQTKQYDNIFFQGIATDEFTGRSGVLDFLRKHNLSLEAAEEISDHFPVWAEFSVHEGGQPGRVATGERGKQKG